MNGNRGERTATDLLNDLQDISFVEIALVIAGTWATIFVVRRLLPFLAERGPSRARLYLLGAVPIIRLGLLVMAILWIVPIVFDVTLQNFLIIAGAVGVAVGFAFKDYVSSLIAGIVAIFERPYRPGDWVEIDGDYGEVRRVGMRAIVLDTADDDTITVPHARLWTDNVSNANDGARTLQCVADFYVAPDHDAARLRSALQEVARTSAYLDYARPVIVVLKELPFGTHYKLRAYPFDLRDQFQFVSDMTVRGKRAIADEGAVEITAPVAASRDDTDR
ncbi:MAG: mechanosensitive ion channel [Geminicoccaceae bacterium]|nr:mechanosensitive ion channel [Geminicoccaceae bacterium]